MYDELRFGMRGDSRNYEDEAEESDERNDIPTASWRRWAVTELNRFDMGTSDADGYDGKDADDVDEEEEALYADGESTQKVEG